MNTDDREPLWRLMQDAYFTGCKPGFSESLGYAAEIRALADIIEKRGEQNLDLDPGETADWLRAEAERAEKGE